MVGIDDDAGVVHGFSSCDVEDVVVVKRLNVEGIMWSGSNSVGSKLQPTPMNTG